MSFKRQRLTVTLACLAALALAVPKTRHAPQAAPTTGPQSVGLRVDPNPIENFVKRANQELLDAVARGDTAVWSRYLAADCLYIDEEGGVSNKGELLSQLHPLPRGYQGTIRLAHPRVIVRGETAVLTADALEELALFGQHLKSRFHLTSTWVQQPEGWKMIASQTSVLPSEHQAAKVDPVEFDAYVGIYQLATDVTYAVTREKTRLYGQRRGLEKEELFPLGCDRFFRVGARRGEKIFARDPKGRVDRMVDRRDNNDLVWRRTK